MARSTRRDWKKEAFWRRLLRGQAQSGLSVRAWCGRHSVRESAFYWWRTQLARREAASSPRSKVQGGPRPDSSSADAVPAFVPVRVTPESSSVAPTGRIEIVLAGDRRVHVEGPVDRQTLADVLAVLAGVPGAPGAPGTPGAPGAPGAAPEEDGVRPRVREAPGC